MVALTLAWLISLLLTLTFFKQPIKMEMVIEAPHPPQNYYIPLACLS